MRPVRTALGTAVLVGTLGATLCVSQATGQSSGGDFSLPRSTFDAGGGTSTGGEFEVTGAIAQVDASAPSSGGPYSVRGGFFAATATDLIFADGFE